MRTDKSHCGAHNISPYTWSIYTSILLKVKLCLTSVTSVSLLFWFSSHNLPALHATSPHISIPVFNNSQLLHVKLLKCIVYALPKLPPLTFKLTAKVQDGTIQTVPHGFFSGIWQNRSLNDGCNEIWSDSN